MDAATFRSFARTAVELQSDSETPPGYTMVKAAVEAKYGLTKEAISSEWVQRMSTSGAHKATDGRLKKFIGKRVDFWKDNPKGPFGPESPLMNNNVAAQAAHSEVARRQPFQRPQTKLAWNAGELTGLGVLATPAAANLAGRPMKEKHKDVAEVAGLGMLAAPYAHNIASKRSAGYAASGLGKHLERVFSH